MVTLSPRSVATGVRVATGAGSRALRDVSGVWSHRNICFRDHITRINARDQENGRPGGNLCGSFFMHQRIQCAGRVPELSLDAAEGATQLCADKQSACTKASHSNSTHPSNGFASATRHTAQGSVDAAMATERVAAAEAVRAGVWGKDEEELDELFRFRSVVLLPPASVCSAM